MSLIPAAVLLQEACLARRLQLGLLGTALTHAGDDSIKQRSLNIIGPHAARLAAVVGTDAFSQRTLCSLRPNQPEHTLSSHVVFCTDKISLLNQISYPSNLLHYM